MQQVAAGSVVWLTVEFFDKAGDTVVPDSISYAVWDQTGGSEVRSSTAIGSPAASVEIELDTDDTALQGASNNIEVRKVCVTSTYGAGDSRTDIFRFEVVRPEACS